MAQLVIGLDVGASSIKVVGLERAIRGFLPVFFDEEPVGQDVDEEGKLLPYPDRARKALEALKARGRLKADIVATGLPGDLATTRLMSLPFSDPKKIAATLPFELEAAIPFDLEDVVFGWNPLPAMPDQEEEGIDVLVGLARKAQVSEFIELLKSVGAEPRMVELEALCLENLRVQLMPDVEQSQPVVATPGGTTIQNGPGSLPSATAILDLGASRTTVSVSADGEVIGARTILRGGQDLTRALSREFTLPLDEAEKGKIKEAYLETPDARAVYPEQQRISHALKTALQPLIREVRQTFQGISARRRVRITRIILCGGASRIPNLDQHLARELNIHVTPMTAVDRALAPVVPPAEGGQPPSMPHAVNAMAYALSALAGTKVKHIDFRQGELSYRGDFEFIAARAPQLVAGLMCLALLGAFNAYARHFVISRSEAVVTARQRDLCKQILGQNVESAERCLAIMREKISPASTGTSAIPQRSAVDAYIQVAMHMPKGITVKVDQLEITSEKIRLKGKTDSFESVDKIVKALEAGECFKKVEKGPARQEADKISWSATVDLECPVATQEVPG